MKKNYTTTFKDEKTTSKKIALIGIGRLQLGLVAPLFSQLGYEIILISFHKTDIFNRLNDLRYYLVIDNPPDEGYKVTINEILFYDFAKGSNEDILAKVSLCQIVNCALGLNENAINAAARFLLDLEIYRRENAIIETLFISSSDNPIGNKFGIELIHKKFQSLTFEMPDYKRVAIWNDVSHHVVFVQTIADRICSQRILGLNKNSPLEIITEKYGELIFDKSFLNIRPLLSKGTKSIGAIKIWDDPETARQKKLYTLSMAHAMTAYLGCFHESSPNTIYQALQIKEIRRMIENSLENVSKALANSEGSSTHEWFQISGEAFNRISNAKIDDTIHRVARDVPRKLNRNDRLIGPLLLINVSSG